MRDLQVSFLLPARVVFPLVWERGGDGASLTMESVALLSVRVQEGLQGQQKLCQATPHQYFKYYQDQIKILKLLFFFIGENIYGKLFQRRVIISFE